MLPSMQNTRADSGVHPLQKLKPPPRKLSGSFIIKFFFGGRNARICYALFILGMLILYLGFYQDISDFIIFREGSQKTAGVVTNTMETSREHVKDSVITKYKISYSFQGSGARNYSGVFWYKISSSQKDKKLPFAKGSTIQVEYLVKNPDMSRALTGKGYPYARRTTPAFLFLFLCIISVTITVNVFIRSLARIGLFLMRLKLLRVGEITRGTITEQKPSDTSFMNGSYVVTFPLKTGEQFTASFPIEQSYLFTPAYRDVPPYQVGSTVPLIYNPDKPKEVEIIYRMPIVLPLDYMGDFILPDFGQVWKSLLLPLLAVASVVFIVYIGIITGGFPSVFYPME